MSRQILITNDDGISADGIRRLAEIARGFGEVTVVAPDTQRSAASHHCIFSRPLILKEPCAAAMSVRESGSCSSFWQIRII